jgi:transposase-like protein
MHCPKCRCAEAVKNGTMNGKQRYKCKACGCNYTQSSLRRIPLERRIHAIKLYLEGVGFRGIERLTGICHNTVILWVRDLSAEIERLRPEMNDTVATVELDEMWHFIQKKRTNAGFGLHGTESENAVVVCN